MFATAYNRPFIVSGESYEGVKSITQPEQVLPLSRIINGLKNGTIFLPSGEGKFDIPEHEIDVNSGKTPELTNSFINDAVLSDLEKSADDAGDDITAAPGFQIEDAHSFIDGIESVVSAAAIKGGRSSAGDDKEASSDSNAIADADMEEPLSNKTGSHPSDAGATV